MAFGPNQRQLNPDPLLTNVVVENSNLGGWLARFLSSVKPVGRDYIRWGKKDTKKLLSNFIATLRAPGARANLLERPVMEWLISIVSEDAVRVEYTEEDVAEAVSSAGPRVDAARQIANVLMFGQELAVAELFKPATFAAANKTAATGAWAGSTSTSVPDVLNAQTVIAERSGLEPNYIRIPRKKLPGWLASDELVKNPQGVHLEMMRGIMAGGLPTSFLGLKVLIGTVRSDATATGVLTPSFVWDRDTLANTVHVGYSPTLDGGSWGGDTPAFVGQFENQRAGTAFAANEYLDPNYQENGVHIVHGNVRRSAPEVFNAELCFAITGV
ncbi:MAG: hypothetical protein WC969_14725 [Elusimicrobiota bacterium]|jgi:hypothetical protein